LETLRIVGMSHFEADDCGDLFTRAAQENRH
jgi:hypothetical protein